MIATVSKSFSATTEAHSFLYCDWERVLAITARIFDRFPAAVVYESPKVLAEIAALLRNFTGPHIIRQDEKRQAMEVFQQALVSVLAGLCNKHAPKRLYDSLWQNSSLQEIEEALTECVIEWRKDFDQ